MKYIKKAQSLADYEELQSNDPTLPLLLGRENSDDIFSIGEDTIINVLDLKDVPGEPTEETDYQKQLDELLSTYGSAE